MVYTLLICAQGTAAGLTGGFETWLRGTEYVNSPNRVFFRWLHEGVLRDWGGELTGIQGGAVIPDMGILPPSCTVEDKFSLGKVEGAVCPAGIDFTR